MEYQPLRRKDLSAEIVARMRADILDGSSRPGDLLPPERELAEQFGVTRNTLRMAMRELEHLHLVSRKHGARYRILDYRDNGGLELLQHLLPDPATGDLDPKVVRSVLDMLLAFYDGLVRVACENNTIGDITALSSAVDALEAAVEAGDVLDAGARLAVFNRVLARSAHSVAFQLLNNTFEALFVDPTDALGSSVIRYVSWLVEDPRRLAWYRELVSAVHDRDSEAARSHFSHLTAQLQGIVLSDHAGVPLAEGPLPTATR